MKKPLLKLLPVVFLMITAVPQLFSQTYHNLSAGSLLQNWTNTSLITTNDNWTGVASIIGYRGDGLASATGVDPQTILGDASPVIDVNANQTNPNTNTTGGITEFEITDPVVAFQGSGTARAPNLVIYIDASNCSSIRVRYNLKDIDGSPDNSVQPVALQYRKGTTGNYVNVPAGFVADASTGPSLATQVTNIDLILPAECNNESQLQLRIITSDAPGSDEWIGIDDIDITKGTDNLAPVPAFNPKNGDLSIPITVVPAITFDESVRKTDGSELVNADLATLVTFKKTSSTGTDVPFTATIDASKKVITITPSASLEKSNYYYLAIGPVEDNSGNESTLKSAIFGTESTGSITVVYPNGGEVMYSGEIKTITWTTTNVDPSELVKIEVWTLTGPAQWGWFTLSDGTPNDGSQDVTVGPEAPYGTEYKIKLTTVTTLATDVSDAPFTVIATATTMADLREYPAGTIIRYDGEAVISFMRATRNQKYLQDATGGLLIDDNSAVLTTVLAVGDKITGLEGQLGFFNGVLQLVPKKSSVVIVSGGNTITPVKLSLPNYLTNHLTYQSMVIQLTNVWFPSADGSTTFAATTGYNLSDGSQNVEFRTFGAGESDIIGTVIPSAHLDLIGIGALNIPTIQIFGRTLADLSVTTAIDRTRESGLVIYPIPASTVLNLRNAEKVSMIEIYDVTGKVIYRLEDLSQGEIRIPVSSLRKGMYFLKLTTPEGKIIRRFIKS